MPFIKVAKPTGTPYTLVNTQGKEQYDQASIDYDDADIFYDGVNTTAYTNLAKPVITGYGDWEGMSMRWEDASASWGSEGGWNNVSKPT